MVTILANLAVFSYKSRNKESFSLIVRLNFAFNKIQMKFLLCALLAGVFASPKSTRAQFDFLEVSFSYFKI